MIPSVLSSPAKRAQKTNSVSCPRVSACRRSSDPPTTLVKTPSLFQLACRFTETHFRNAPQEIDRGVVSVQVRESVSVGTRPITVVVTPSKEVGISEVVAHRIPATIPKTGYVGWKPMSSLSSPQRAPPRNAPASRHQAFRMQRCCLRRPRSTRPPARLHDPGSSAAQSIRG